MEGGECGTLELKHNSVPKLQSCLGVGVENLGPQKDSESGKFGGKGRMN